MSTLVEAVSVVIPRHVLDVSYPGGSDAYLEGARRAPGVRFAVADARLTSVSLSSLDEAAVFVRPLESIGLTTPDGRPLAIACVDEHFGPTTPAPWLRWRRHDDGYTSCWLEWTDPGELSAPDGWPEHARAGGRVSAQADGRAGATLVAANGSGDPHAGTATLVADAAPPPPIIGHDPFGDALDASFAEPFEESFDDGFDAAALGDGPNEASSNESPSNESQFDEPPFDEPPFDEPSFGDASFETSSPFEPPPLDPSLAAAAEPALLDDHLDAMHVEPEPDPTAVPSPQPEAAPVTLATPIFDATTTADAVPLIDAVRQGLDRRGWRHSLDDAQRTFFYQVSGARASYPGSAMVDEDEGMARVYTHLPVRVPEHRRAEAVELLTRANHGLPMGNFEFDYRDGEVRFKATAESGPDGLAPSSADRLLQAGLAACDRFHDALMQVIYGGVSAVAALQTARA
jgi:hypothetical protein